MRSSTHVPWKAATSAADTSDCVCPAEAEHHSIATTTPAGRQRRIRASRLRATRPARPCRRSAAARPFTLFYNLDGSPTVNAFGDGTAVAKLRREGHGLLTETVYTVNNQPVTVREWLPSAPTGAELAIEVMVRLEHGYQGVPPPLESGAPNDAKAIKFFQKQP